ncbi:MAG: hypothetical protein V3R83_04005 [Gammaproteobacteria bacterium]
MGIGRPVGTTHDKLWRSAIVRAVKRRTGGKGSPRHLDRLASVLVREGGNGNVAAIKEVGDRLDGKPAQAVAITGDPDSPVIFNLRLGDGIATKVIDGEIVPEKALGAPLVAIATQDDED